MNPILTLLQHPVAQTLGWTLLHFLWQGAALGLLAWLALLLLRGASAKARYGLACAFLLLMVATPVITFLLLRQQAPLLAGGAALNLDLGTSAAVTLPMSQRLKVTLDPALPWLLAGWALGVLLLSVRFLGSWVRVQRLRRRSAEPVPAAWHLVVSRLCRELKLSRTVRLVQSAAVEVPTALGWLRPLILLPACALTGLAPLQLEAILAHELAHIRRGDFLVNLLQSLVEVLLFYHPAVWWLSARIRAERELCCDDVAAELCGDPLLLARALADLEALREPLTPSPTHLALAANGGSLMHRIRHLIHPALPITSGARATALALLAASLLGAAGVALQDKETAPRTDKTGSIKAEEKRQLKVSRKGDVSLNGEAPDPVTIRGEGSFKVEETKEGQSRSYSATQGSATYALNGQVLPLDKEGRDWLRGIIRDLKQTQGGPRQVRVQKVEGEDKEIQIILRGHEKPLSAEAQAKQQADLAKALAKGMKHLAEADRLRLEAEAIKSDPELKALIEKAEKDGHRVQVKVLRPGGDPGGPEITIVEPGDLPGDAEGKPLRIRVPRVRVETHVIHGDEDPRAEMAELQAELRALQTRLDQLQRQMAAAPKAPRGVGPHSAPPPPPPPPPPPAPEAPPVPPAPPTPPAPPPSEH